MQPKKFDSKMNIFCQRKIYGVRMLSPDIRRVTEYVSWTRLEIYHPPCNYIEKFVILHARLRAKDTFYATFRRRFSPRLFLLSFSIVLSLFHPLHANAHRPPRGCARQTFPLISWSRTRARSVAYFWKRKRERTGRNKKQKKIRQGESHPAVFAPPPLTPNFTFTVFRTRHFSRIL